jgi:hypothetical protein
MRTQSQTEGAEAPYHGTNGDKKGTAVSSKPRKMQRSAKTTNENHKRVTNRDVELGHVA